LIVLNIIDSFKRGYYALEDRYYTVLDKINHFVPIYKIIDPIDKAFPSFILFIALIACLVIFFALLTWPAAAFSTIINVVDESSNPIEGVSINLLLGDANKNLSTDSWGDTNIAIAAKTVTATASFSKEGFEDEAKKISLSAGEKTKVTLKGITAVFQPLERTIKVVDGSTSDLLKKKVTITYSCSGGASAPLTQQNESGEPAEFRVMQPTNCLVLTATASADGYETKSKTIAAQINYITLYPATADTTGTVNVIVKNNDGTYAPDITVRLINSTTNAVVDSSSTLEAGSAAFSEVEPDTYTVSATAADGRTAQQTNVVVTAGGTETVSLTLPKLVAGKKILLQLVEAATENKVADATVFFYKNNVPIDSKTSNAQGIVEMPVSDTNVAYLAVIVHPDYITLIQPNLPLKEAADSEPTKIALTKATATNSSKAIAVVLDEDSKKVVGASVWVYNSQYPIIPLNYVACDTNKDGTCVFGNLAAATYFARAEDPDTKATGESERKAVAAGQTVVLNVKVVLAEGTVEVTVYDAESASKEKIPGALVEFINRADANVLSTCTTDSTGKCESAKIKADKFVIVRASKQGFIGRIADRVIDIVKGKVTIEIGLRHEGTGEPIAGIDSTFEGFCNDWECKSPNLGLRIESDESLVKTYFGKFTLSLSKNVDYSDIAQHIRVGLNSDRTLPANFGIKITDVRAPFANIAVLSKCWNGNSANPFEESSATECATTIDAKQANIYYNYSTGRWDFPITVKFAIEKGLPDKTPLRFYFKAKAIVDGNAVATPEKVQIFEVGSVFCKDVDFAWGFKLGDANGSSVILPLDPRQSTQLTVNAEYGLSYWIYNCSGKDFAAASLSAKNIPPLQVLSFEESVDNFGPINAFPMATIPFGNNTEKTSEALDKVLKIYPRKQTDVPTKIDFNLSVGQTVRGNSATLAFTVKTGKTLRVLNLPETLSDLASSLSLSGTVVDETNQTITIEGAFVKLTIPERAAIDTRSGADGRFSFNESVSLSSGEIVKLEVRKSGYNPLQIDIPVESQQVTPSADYNCVSFGTETVTIDRADLSGTSFSVKTASCPEDVEITLESELDLSEGQFTLGNNIGELITVKPVLRTPSIEPGVGIGEYFVDLFAQFESDRGGRKGPLQRLRVIVTDSTSGLCFRLADPTDPNDPAKMKSTYNISGGTDNGRIYNGCFKFIEDLLLPSIRKVNVHAASEEVFSLRYGLPPLSPPEEKTRQQTFSAMPLQAGAPLTISVTDGGGFVTLNWVDVFMTDEQHLGNATHRLWAHFFKGENDWLNITGMLPYTPTQMGTSGTYTVHCHHHWFQLWEHCYATNKSTGATVEIPVSVIDNEGWVDTDTYHPVGAKYDKEVTKDPMWQAQHNVCNNNIKDADGALGTCYVNGYFSGRIVQPYAVGSRADKIKLEVDGNNTKITQIKWHYTNTDPNHADPSNPSVGIIDFDVINNSLVGETYALVEVEDTVFGSGVASQTLDFNWTLTQTKFNEMLDSITQLGAAQQQTLAAGEMLAVSVNRNATEKFRKYADDTDTNLNAALSALGSTAVNLDTIKIKMSVQQTAKISIKFYAGDAWHDIEGENGSKQVDIEPGDSDEVFKLPAETAVKVVAITNLSNSTDLSVAEITFERNYREQVGNPVEQKGISRIDAGETFHPFSIDLNPTPEDANVDLIEYAISDDKEGIATYFNDTKTASTERRAGNNDPLEVIAMTSSLGVNEVTKKELFHIRLTGVEQKGCVGYGGLSGQTGFIAKPRVLLSWDWNAIAIDSCDANNLNYIYCDPTQFSISLVKRLEAMNKLAKDDQIANADAINSLRWFNAYLIDDNYSPDFRNDFATYYSQKAFGVPLQGLHEQGSCWDDYFKNADKMHFKRIMPDGSEIEGAPIEAGLYEVFIEFQQPDFFIESPECVPKADITIKFRKLQAPAIYSPFYYLPFNGNLGEETDAITGQTRYDRVGYGLRFNNTGQPLLLTSDLSEDAVLTESTSGASVLIETEKITEFNQSLTSIKGMILEIATDLSEIKFAPSIATPVLAALLPEQDGKVEAYYYLTRWPSGERIASPAQSFMNLWTGSGSSMRNGPAGCKDYAGRSLPFMAADNKAPRGSCEIAGGNENSYGYSFTGAKQGEQLYYESVFFVPLGEAINLHSACENKSVFYSPVDSTIGGSPVSISKIDVAKAISNVQDVINLVNDEYVCVTAASDSIKFWWNPQMILSELDSKKQAIATALNKDWENDLTCTVSVGR
jgi:RNase P/RNase MRP subunit p29